MRTEVLKSICGVYFENVSGETEEKFEAVGDYIFKITKSEKERENINEMMTDFMYSVFMDSTNLLLDFISGKDVNV